MIREPKWYIHTENLGNPTGTSRQKAEEIQVVRPVKKPKVSKRLGNPNDTSCQNAEGTQMVRSVKNLGEPNWYILLKSLGNPSGTSCQEAHGT